MNRINCFRQSHPAELIQLARDSQPPLKEPEYSRQLEMFVSRATGIGADDPATSDALVRAVTVAYQDAAIDSVIGGVF
jgi:hypothetical protein